MPIDIRKLFNEHLPASLARNADEARSIGARYQVNVTGPTGGEWNVDATAAGPSVTAGSGPADCTITLADEDFQKLIENPANSVPLFFAGKLKVSGNQLLAPKLQKLFAFK